MTDLTVLISPSSYPIPQSAFKFGVAASRRRASPLLVRPVMVTLESEREDEEDLEPNSGRLSEAGDPNQQNVTVRSPRARPPPQDSALLSPPLNTWKAPRPRPRHRPQRSNSAPPTPIGLKPQLSLEEQPQRALDDSSTRPITPPRRYLPQRRQTTILPIPSYRYGEPIKPPPPLLRPTTFWRKTKRSGVTGASYSPSSHLVRRSTFIAAGLTFDAPIHDLSAFCVESRVGFILLPPDQII
ncbi:hypothetical protein HGRIS_010855 [Hohenbuehelia grisea]|uniref:Uncharacterized protein n=1 Tax=Hohenbuehelia grisea TaxID=104357 RepID=A0ABR3IY09_9AGAR